VPIIVGIIFGLAINKHHEKRTILLITSIIVPLVLWAIYFYLGKMATSPIVSEGFTNLISTPHDFTIPLYFVGLNIFQLIKLK
jgi:hypothetical protein